MRDKKCFFDNLANTYKNSCPKKLALIKEKIIPLLNLQPADNVLDLCGGTGVLVPFLKPRVITEVDFSPEMLKKAKTLHGYAAEYVLADAQNLPFENETFSKAICHNAFPHIDNKQKALKEVFRVLRAGGLFVISHDGSKHSIDNRHKKIGGCIAGDLIPAGVALSAMIGQAGFTAEIIDNDEMFAAVCRKGACPTPK